MEELMPFVNSSYSSSLAFYHAANPNALFMQPKVRKAKREVNSPKVQCNLTMVNAAYPMPQQYTSSHSSFLSKLFTEQLLKHFDEIYAGADNCFARQFYAKSIDTLIEVEENSISLSGPSEDKLAQGLFKLAVLTYRSYPNVSLMIDCKDAALKKSLEKVLDQAFLAVANNQIELYAVQPTAHPTEEAIVYPELNTIPSAPPAWMMAY
jgi:hypothetical protein